MRPVENPPNPYEERSIAWEDGEAPPAMLELYEEEAKSALVKNDSPDVGFTWGINPYRGCFHACAYCFARPSHQYLGFGAGTDFDRRIVVKTNIATLLHKELARPSWKGEPIAISGNTDCYQPIEASYGLTRKCLEVCLEYKNPVHIISKGAVVMRRDLDVLAALARAARVHVCLSVTFVDDEQRRKIEPFTASIPKRIETIRMLADAGVPVGIMIGPVIPGLNDDQIPEILSRCREAGATTASFVMLKLAREVKDVFIPRLEQAFPLRAKKVLNAVRDVRGGKLNESAFGARQVGTGPRWDAIEAMFNLHHARLGYSDYEYGPSTYTRPTRQLALF